MSEKITINFLGAAGMVTGSKYLVTAFGKQLLVDCGMFQGLKELRLLNWEYPPVNIPDIDLVLVTHGHLDHVGYLPKLIKGGYRGNIIGTKPTLDIATIILKDSAKIQEEEAERANRYGYSKHKPAKPFYDMRDVENTLTHFKAIPEEEWINLDEQIRARFRYNGHIIGATFIELEIGSKRLVFSGDIGRENDLLMRPPEKPERADVLFIESTYGNRRHPVDEARSQLADAVSRTISRGGTVIIPSFAVERAQLLMYLLWQLHEDREIPECPVYLDSPMGKDVLEVFHAFTNWHKLSPEDCTRMCNRIHRTSSFSETQSVIDNPRPKIVIAGSGMATGGRVLSYMQKYLGDEKSSILLAGFQAEGTRGRRLLEGEKTLRIYGKDYDVKSEIISIEGLSAHADQEELLGWMSKLKHAPEKIFIVHGEPAAAQAFGEKIRERYGWDAVRPKLFDIVEIPLPETDHPGSPSERQEKDGR